MKQKTVNYRGYLLAARSGEFGARCWGWKDKTPVHKTTGGTVDEAILAARRAIDEELGTPQHEGSEAEAAYADALAVVLPSLTAPQIRMLQAHYHAPGRTMTATELAAAAGYASYSGANLQYGMIGKAILEQHPIEVKKRQDGTPIYTFALANEGGNEQYGDTEAPEWKWKMLPALAHALRSVGVVSDK